MKLYKVLLELVPAYPGTKTIKIFKNPKLDFKIPIVELIFIKKDVNLIRIFNNRTDYFCPLYNQENIFLKLLIIQSCCSHFISLQNASIKQWNLKRSRELYEKSFWVSCISGYLKKCSTLIKKSSKFVRIC